MRKEEPSGLFVESLRSLAECRDVESVSDVLLRGAMALGEAKTGYFFPVTEEGRLEDPLKRAGLDGNGGIHARRAAERALESGEEAREEGDGVLLLAFPLSPGVTVTGVCCLWLDDGDADTTALKLYLSHAALVMENLALHRRLGERGGVNGDIVITPVKERHVRAAREMLDGAKKPVTRADLAEHAGISPDYLGKLFRRCTGKALRDYRNEARVKRALDLLAGNGLTLEEAGREAGFASRRSFYRVFKKMVGMTPAEYRRMMGGVIRNQEGN